MFTMADFEELAERVARHYANRINDETTSIRMADMLEERALALYTQMEAVRDLAIEFELMAEEEVSDARD